MRFVSKSTFENDYRIKFYDLDKHMNCKVSALINYLWDVVVAQSEYQGETEGTHINKDLVWMLLKYDIKIHEYPKINDVITADTVVIGVKKFYGYRTHTIRNSEGKVLVEIKSIAILVDLEKRRPTKVTQEQCDIYGLEGEYEGHVVLDDLYEIKEEEIEKIYEVRHSDIDLNGHMNNVIYIERAMDTMPNDIIDNYCLSGIKILFKKESMLGENIRVLTNIEECIDGNIKSIHNIIGEDEKIHTKLEFIWRKLE
ncbi:MAG: acyl-[acyl-carrier-protein] thioesterase, partial [Sarcina sp.]